MWHMKNVYKIFPILSIALLILSCMGPKISVIDDPKLNRTIYRVTSLFVDVDQKYTGPYGNTMFKIDMYVSKVNRDTSLYLEVGALTRNGIDLARGDTLELIIDADRYYLACLELAQEGDTVTFGTVYSRDIYILEGGWFKIDRALVSALAHSESVSFSISSKKGSLPGRFNANNLKKIREFYNKFVI
jgi:hypothetical protein